MATRRKIKKRREYRFKIDAFSPDTMPMSRLAEYVRDLATLFGEEKSVHLIKIEDGSTTPVILVEWESEPKVRSRLHDVRNKEGPPEAMRAAKDIDKRLEKDNAKGTIVDPVGTNLIKFPGRDRAEQLQYGPFNQQGSLDGMLIGLGGKRDLVPVHLEDRNGQIYLCHANRSVARKMAPHIFGPPLRANGIGRWHRETDGTWIMDRFMIATFDVLRETPLRQIVDKFRQIPSVLSKEEDPVEMLNKIRHGGNGAD